MLASGDPHILDRPTGGRREACRTGGTRTFRPLLRHDALSLGRRVILVGFSKSTVFSSFFFLTGLAQTILMAVVPLEAFRLLGGARNVSIVYLIVGVTGFLGRVTIPLLIRMTSPFGVFVTGSAALCLSAGLLAAETPMGLVAGLILNVFALACFEIVLNLLVLDHIQRNELGRFEAKRIFVAAAPYTMGPWLGVYLQLHAARWLPFAVAGVTALVLLLYFRICGLALAPRAHPPSRRSSNPALYLRRFFSQPRLRLAWALAAGRSAWWSLFQIYAPIFAVKSGLGEQIGGAIVSIGLGWMWTVPLWGWAGRHFGLRRLLMAGYAATGLITLAAAALMGTSLWGAGVLVLSALAAESLDGAGNTLYLRAVHPHERGEMTAVFVTYRDFAQLVPPALFAALLAVFELPAVFIAGGAMMLGMSLLTRYIPRRL
ncbi:MAG: MFS transporter [Alphaproteobacteria bacterium]|nr:MFS transporter [Alphaproteobacteria bacterium]